jgi:hypothetical protein
MIGTVLFSLLLIFQDNPPFKPSEDFEIKFDLSFKQRSQLDNKTVHLTETEKDKERRTNSTPLPYLILHFKLLKIHPDEEKLKVIKDDKNFVLNKKIKESIELRLDVGFTDDVKDRISGYKHVIQFLSVDKKVLSVIVIEFDDEGNYTVNGELRGKI